MASRRFERAFLDRQADRIERALRARAIPARVHGGEVHQRTVRYHLTPPVGANFEAMEEAADAVADAIGVSEVDVCIEEGGVSIEVPLEFENDLRLLPLLHAVGQPPPLQATIGMGEDGRPLALDFTNPQSWHLAIRGRPGSGKSELIRTTLISLALTNRRSRLQLLGVDIGGRELAVVEALPHGLTDLGSEADFAMELLGWLANEASRRSTSGVQSPHIFLAIDDLGWSQRVEEAELNALLGYLAEVGVDVGVHLIIAARPSMQAALEHIPVDLRVEAEAKRNGRAGEFTFSRRGRAKAARVAWLSVRDLDTAVSLVNAGWRAPGKPLSTASWR